MASIATIDLFAGAGGLGLGARAAGAELRLSVDLDPASCATLVANADSESGRVLCEDVGTLTGLRLRAEAGLGTKEPLLIVGGPPCQGFSKAAYWVEDGDEARYRRERGSGNQAGRPVQGPRAPDARRHLVAEFMRLVIESDATAFVFENVTSITHPRNRAFLDTLLETARLHGYRTAVERLNAVEYGVPQRRQRLVVLGTRDTSPALPAPSHDNGRVSVPGRWPAVTAGSALAPLGETDAELGEVVSGRWASHLREVPRGFNYKSHTAKYGHPDPSFVDETRYWNFLLKLSPDLPSWTIVANPGPWVGPFHWDSRRLRIPELAALQTFPEGYAFCGTRREQVRQLGNAVPPLLASKVIAALLETLGISAETAVARA